MPATRAPHYRVVGVLGRGATAVVELAVAPDGTRVARKRVALTGSAVDIDQARTRLRREAVVLARLRHPGIVPVLAVDDDAGDLVIVMPALVGNLADRVAAGGPLPPAEVAEGAVTLLGALATAHAAGVVHRDVKPANVLVDHRGRLALADFGLAGGPATTAGLTMAGTVLGTPAWMAPEQARGEPVGPAADVFALGATLLFAATGATPWGDGPPAAALARAASGAPCRLPATTPSSLAGLLAAMLRPDPRQRPGAAALLAAAPVAAAGGSPATAPTAPAGAPARPAHLAATTPLAPAPPLATPLVAPLTPTALDLGRGRGRPGRPDPGHAGRMPRRGHRPARTLALPAAAAGLVGVALLATLTVGGGPGAAGRGASAAAAKGAAGGRPAAPSCTPLPYQPCGQPAAAGTDGRACLPGFYDLDGSAADGCEATSDWRPGTTVGAAAVHANVVPPSAVDTFTARVDGHLTSFCGGRLDLHLTAPTAAVDQLQVRDPSGRLLATATSAGGEAATASVAKPGCFGDHSETLHLEVRTVAGASAADFRLTRSGGW